MRDGPEVTLARPCRKLTARYPASEFLTMPRRNYRVAFALKDLHWGADRSEIDAPWLPDGPVVVDNSACSAQERLREHREDLVWLVASNDLLIRR